MQSEANRHALRQRAYAMKKHRATRLHYDLRLEWNGVLLSWALPEGPSCRVGTLREAIESCLRKGLLRFTLYGEKLKGGWTLTRTNRNAPRPIWTLSKLADSFAESVIDKSILEEQPNSIGSGRTMDEIVCDWTSPKNKYIRQTKLFGGSE